MNEPLTERHLCKEAIQCINDTDEWEEDGFRARDVLSAVAGLHQDLDKEVDEGIACQKIAITSQSDAYWQGYSDAFNLVHRSVRKWFPLFSNSSVSGKTDSSTNSVAVVNGAESTNDSPSVEEKDGNPAHNCFECDKYIGHRGWCSQECVDKWCAEFVDDLPSNASASTENGSQSKRVESAVNSDVAASPSSADLKDIRGDSRKDGIPTVSYVILCEQCYEKNLNTCTHNYGYKIKFYSLSQPKEYKPDPDHDSGCEGTMCGCKNRRKNRGCTEVNDLPCPHGRSSWKGCPHCLGINK